jgi:hypothetical protein
MNNNNHDHLLDVLTREGVLLNVSVRYWRATKKLKAEDLGLNPDDITERFISLGHKRLLPRDKLEAFALIESRAHALVEANTFPFLNGLGHFLPNAKLAEVTGKLGELETEFSREKTTFLERYAELRREACDDWHEAARLLVKDPARTVAVIAASFPEASRMESQFGFSTHLYQIQVPEGMALEMVQMADQQQIALARTQAALAAGERIQQEVHTFVSDCVATLRQETAQLCEEMLRSIHTGKTGVHQKTLNRLIRFIDEFKQLNFVGDQQMAAELERVRQEFLQRSAEEYRDSDAAKARLQQGLRALADTARQLAQQDTRELVERFGALGQRRFHLELEKEAA